VAAQLSKEEAAVVLENRPLLEQFGFFVEDFGDGDVLLRQVPADLDPDEAQAALAALAAQLLEGRQADPAAMRDELLHTMACKSAIKAGWTTAPQEIEALVREVLTRDDIKYCPHGRPVCVTMTQGFLEKQFKRT
jgi:DNA mismatch repair protein MutL